MKEIQNKEKINFFIKLINKSCKLNNQIKLKA